MAVSYRKMTLDDVDIIVDMRINHLREEGADEDKDISLSLKNFYNKHLKDNTFVSWLAVDNEKIVATSGVSFYEKPPYYSNPTGKIGILSMMYTLKEYRRKGIATELLEKIADDAREYGCGTIHITGSNEGVLLYSNFGFKKNNNFMFYNL